MRIPFLRSKPEAVIDVPKRRARATPPLREDPVGVEAARTQARRRLVGALVLLLIGVAGFPILFETQPRPLPMDTPIEAPRRENVASGPVLKDVTPSIALQAPVLPPDPGVEEVASGPAPAKSALEKVPAKPDVKPAKAEKLKDPKVEAVQAASTAAAATAASATAVARSASAVPKVVASAAPAAAPTTPTPANSALTASASASSPAPSASERFIVQAGAYKDSAKLREARSKIENLGYKTYTQVIESDTGTRTRVRIGPYGTRAEAEAAAARIRHSGLSAVIIAL